MILAAADPGAHDAFTLGYALTVIAFGVALVVAAILARYLDITIGRHIRRRARRALDNGDRNLSAAADAMYATRRRQSVPRRLEDQR